MQRVNHLPRRVISIVLTIVMVASLFSGILPGLGVTAKAAANEIANDSLKISVGDLGQISTLNIVKNPRVWIAPTVTSAITGPIATCLFRLQMNGAAINSGMGTCGLCGQLGVWTGWVAPSEKALANGAIAMNPTAFDWAGLILISFILPAILCPLINQLCRKAGWVKDGDLKLP